MKVEGDLYVKLGARTYVSVTMNTKDVDNMQADLMEAYKSIANNNFTVNIGMKEKAEKWLKEHS